MSASLSSCVVRSAYCARQDTASGGECDVHNKNTFGIHSHDLFSSVVYNIIFTIFISLVFKMGWMQQVRNDALAVCYFFRKANAHMS
jgi:hypothetical protein